MKYGPVSFTDRLGREVILRNADLSDGERLIEYLKATAAETPFLARDPDEITLTAEQENEFITEKTEDPKELLLIAEIAGEHVGNCSVMRLGGGRRYAHRCDIGIALYRKYCGCGIGEKMLRTVLDAAKEMGYGQAELEVVAGNTGAIALYEKLGFTKYGVFPDNMKYQDGTYADAVWMMKKL